MADKQGKELYEIPVDELNEWLEDVTLTEQDWQQITDPYYFVQRRRVTGGTNPDVVREMIDRRKE